MDKYLDNAVLSNLNRVYLIHGKDRPSVYIQEHLKHHVHVKSQRLGEQGEGGTGVTVVDLTKRKEPEVLLSLLYYLP